MPRHGWFGLGLALLAWALNWSLPGLRTHLLFAPLWLGYVLAVDGLVVARTGTSLLTRSRARFAGLFLASMPCWWLFEVLNWRTRNWSYLGREHFSDLEYFVLASVSFSTVIPAVFETAELWRSGPWIERTGNGPSWAADWRPSRLLFAGLMMLALLLAWPRFFFPFVWVSVWLLVEAMNDWLGHRTLLSRLRVGDWRSTVAVALGALTCGFFWELWNWLSYPKWTYDVPFVGFLRVFEMPLLGYGGYLPFALELFALYHLAIGLLRLDPDYVRL